VRKRTRGRELALQLLYMVDARGDEALLQVDEFLEQEEPDETEVHEFARQLLSGTLDQQEEIDKAISSAAQNWNIRRMAIVDRNILRMAVYEMIYLKDIPAKVSINEAIEMGKRFSTQQSGAFINGILDRIRREKGL